MKYTFTSGVKERDLGETVHAYRSGIEGLLITKALPGDPGPYKLTHVSSGFSLGLHGSLSDVRGFAAKLKLAGLDWTLSQEEIAPSTAHRDAVRGCREIA